MRAQHREHTSGRYGVGVPRRCEWVPVNDPAYVAYHDREWGVPSRDERHLFEMLTLEGAQAGLSWSTILKKRDGYRRAFADFDAPAVARFDRRRVERLLRDPAIVRNRLKVESAVNNARRILDVQDELGGFADYVWGFVDGAPIVGKWRSISAIPAQTPESKAMSKDLKRRGFRFVGPTVCYAFMQTVGLVNDHTTSCFRYKELT
jgi:DNA-3-methyladenine glycosylase I